MKKTKSRRILLGAGLLLGYILLLLLLVLLERPADGSTILTLPTAFWYSVTTLTTVGYGDTYPVTGGGRLIGLLFQLMSLGVLAALLSVIVRLLQGRLLPVLKLRFSRRKNWYLFTDAGEGALSLAEKLRQKEDCVIVLPVKAKEKADPSLGAVYTDLEPAFLIKKHPQPEKVTVFFLSGNSLENEKGSAELSETGCRICLLSEREAEIIPENVICFHPEEAMARLYWHRYPLQHMMERIVLVGSGKTGRALLEQALLLNVLSPGQSVRYVLKGDWSEFFREHPYTERFLSLGREERGKDAILFPEGPWNGNWELFQGADRILFCDDSEALNAERAASLKRFCPVSGTVYARLSTPMDGVTVFGSTEEVYVPELILGEELNRLAVRLHESYLEKEKRNDLPGWNGLGSFLRRSNLASADHLSVKARILLGAEAADRPESWGDAAGIYRALPDSEKERCRRIEHERWNRFHLMNNWQYGPVRDNARRIHPLIRPFEALSPEDQAKDDYAWELLSEAAGKAAANEAPSA